MPSIPHEAPASPGPPSAPLPEGLALAISQALSVHQACQAEARFCGGISGYSAQILRFEADTRTGRGIRNCFILSLFGLTLSPIARSSKKKRTTPKQRSVVRILPGALVAHCSSLLVQIALYEASNGCVRLS